jgi:outer membrane biosynthesis protein TonB
MKHLFKDEWFVSVTSTILLHLLLLTFFILFKIDFRPAIAEFVEISFTGGWEAPAIEDIAYSDQKVDNPETLKPIESQPEQDVRSVELPARRQLDLSDEIVEKVQPELDKIVEGPPAIKRTPVSSAPTTKPGQPFNPFLKKEKKVESGVFKKGADERLLTGTQKVDINLDRAFEIDWMGDIKREIYQKRLPEFPEDVHREAVIKIKFNVLPNGLVGYAVLMQKGDTRLENLTLETFKTWRFNPLPNYLEQASQTGIITFRFKLR